MLTRFGFRRSLCPIVECRSGGGGWSSRQTERSTSSSYGRREPTNRDGGSYGRRESENNDRFSSGNPHMGRASRPPRDDEDEDDSEAMGDAQEGEDRPLSLRNQQLGEVLYGVYPVLNALKAKRYEEMGGGPMRTCRHATRCPRCPAPMKMPSMLAPGKPLLLPAGARCIPCTYWNL